VPLHHPAERPRRGGASGVSAGVRAALAAAVAVLAALAVSAAAGGQPPSGVARPPDEGALSDPQLGAELYAGNCSSCHGIDGRGVYGPAQAASGNVATGLHAFTEHCAGCHQVAAEGGYVTDVRVPPIKQDSPVQIAEAVRIGPYLMPTFSKTAISDAELNSIVAYLQQAKKPD